MSHRTWRTAIVVGLLASHPPIAASGQETVGSSGIHGSVVAADTGAPLAGVTITLEVLPGGVLSNESGTTAGALAVIRRTLTGEEGNYRFSGLSPGSYRLRIIRLGYRPETLEVHYDAPADPRVSIGLQVSPIELHAVEASPAASGVEAEFSTVLDVRAVEDRARIHNRQERFAQADVRVITGQEVQDAMTLGETDLLRTLQRLPGVVADDDWSAEPWTRGSRWDETRIYLDGMPLYDPMHGGGVFTSLSPDLVGSMVFHPGIRPTSSGQGTAGVVEMTTRPALGNPHLSALAQVSLASGRFAIERPIGGRSGITFSGRRTYVEEATRDLPAGDGRFPYTFTDWGGRWDQALGRGFHLMLSGVSTEDRIEGDLPHGVKGVRGRWGNGLIQGTLQMDRWGVRMRFSEGRARYRAAIETTPFDDTDPDLDDAVLGSPARNVIETHTDVFTIQPLTQGGVVPNWEAGWEDGRTTITYDGPAAVPFPTGAIPGSASLRSRHETDAVWGALRLEANPTVLLTSGLRATLRQAGEGNDSNWFLAPRLSLRWRTSPLLTLSAAVGRHYQFEQAVSAAGFSAGPNLSPTHIWVPTGTGVSPLRSDMISLSGERWVGSDWLSSATLYVRKSHGHLTPRPEVGPVSASPILDGGRLGNGWTSAKGTALGLEIAAQRITGRLTGSASYALARSRYSVGNVEFPGPGDRRHAVDATVRFHWTGTTRVGTNLTATSGAPFTRFIPLSCPGDEGCLPEDNASAPVIGVAEAPNGERRRAYVALDLHFEHEGRLFGLPYGTFIQLRNVLGRRNRSAYLGSAVTCGPVQCETADTFEDGVPRLPLFGFWIRL